MAPFDLSAGLAVRDVVQHLASQVHGRAVGEVEGDDADVVPGVPVLDASADSCTCDFGFAVTTEALAVEYGCSALVFAGFSCDQLPVRGAVESRPLGHGHPP